MVMKQGQEPRRMRKDKAELLKGDLIRLKTGAGGGYGDPLDTDVQEVAWDARNDYITRQDVERISGFFFKGDSLEPDLDDSAKRRQQTRTSLEQSTFFMSGRTGGPVEKNLARSL